ncbi:vitronectin a [Sebastes fasciatus]|uniref:vitronectin a n=1 Tax=Sebastes fasciatus TaxID=394691 RepID=UPI003D9DC08D
MWLRVVLLLALLALTFAADNSCEGRCNVYGRDQTCQCEKTCKHYKNCCPDYEDVCGKPTRGDTFAFAEDDDGDGELFEGPTPSPGRSAHGQSFTGINRLLRPTQRPISDFSRRPQQHPQTTLRMTRPPRLMETIHQEAPVPPAQMFPSTTKPPQGAAAAETTTVNATTAAPTEAPDPDAVACSGRPFDSFMQVKNGSIFAFRGDYFFELDQKVVLPGYPKLIKDVWGISGPIDAAFTRVNCQGKTYIFKGHQYWRFDNGVLDEDYPRDISVGFDTIPDHMDAAFALPAPDYNGRERVYFFKADQYHMYEFMHQPSHKECITMSERSPSTLFSRYMDVYNNYDRVMSELFSGSGMPQHHDKHHFIDKDWKGLMAPVDAAMAGRIYVPAWRPTQRRNDRNQQYQQYGQQQNQQYQQYGQQMEQQYQQYAQQQNQQYQQYAQQLEQQYQQYAQQQNQQYQQYGQQYGQQWGRRRQSRSPFWESMADRGMNMGQGFAERGMEMGLRLAEKRMEMEERLGRDGDRRRDQDWDQDRRRDGYRQNNRGNYDSRGDRRYWESIQGSQPIQAVYFFKGDKYYRVNLKTKRVDFATPPYPRSIAKYWLGCSDTTGAEK